MNAKTVHVLVMIWSFVAPLGLAWSPLSARDHGIPDGKGEVTIKVDHFHLEVFTYRAKNYWDAHGPLIMVFHGHNRNADGYRDHAKRLGDESGGLVVCPFFDQDQFPRHAYNDGNVMGPDKHGPLQPRHKWSFSVVPKLIDKIRAMEGRPDMAYYFLGHSAGGQFVERLMALGEVKPIRAVAANPGSHMFPTMHMQFPYGFGGLPDSIANEQAFRAYLAAPLTIYLGTADTDPNDPDVDKSKTAEEQGPYRLVRGHNCYKAAQHLAKTKGWEFHWRLVEAPDIGHSATKMFHDPACWKALFTR